MKMQGSSGTWNYTYDTSGLRTERSNGSTTYRYWYNDSGLLLRMEKGSTVYSFTYDAFGRPVSFTEGNTRYFYVLNQQGDVVAIINGNGDFVVEYYYDAWGRLLSATGTLATALGVNNPLRYRGYVYDTETGLYYLQSRYYNPTWGRFINADDPGYMGIDGTMVSYNLFAYGGNNPVSNYDPTGRFVITTAIITGAIIGGTVNFVSSFISEAIGGFDENSWKKILSSTAIGFLEGGFSAAFPGAGWAISFGASVADSVASDLIEGNTNLGQIAVNALFSGAIGAVGGSGKNPFADKSDLINDGISKRLKLLKKGLHPNVKTAARKAGRQAKRYLNRTYLSNQLESLAYTGMNELSHRYIESVLF